MIFLKIILKTQVPKAKTDKWHGIKLKSFYTAKKLKTPLWIPGAVAHACNPSSWGGRGGRIV